MIFDSLGMGELGVIAVLVLLLVEPKKVGHFIREAGRYKRKILNFQHDMRGKLDQLILEQETRELQGKPNDDTGELRRKFRDHIRRIPSMERSEASSAVLSALSDWEVYRNARVVSCFIGIEGEIDTEGIARKILRDGKTLLVPYLLEENQGPPMPDGPISRSDSAPEAKRTILPGLAPVENFDSDLVEGQYGLREPGPQARSRSPSSEFIPDLHLVPGLVFDIHGGRIGKGMGFYDRLLSRTSGIRAALCFGTQVVDFNLPLQAHDQKMDFIISEKGLIRANTGEKQA